MVRRLLSRSFLLLLVAPQLGCSDDEIPAISDIGFDFEAHSFAFANFADFENDFGGDQAARMFGAEVVCSNAAMPCAPNAAADGWISLVRESLREGRSEGFAVLSLLFFSGELTPADFGADTVGELRLEGNVRLRSELAYWAGSQLAPDDGTTRRFSARDVMPFLGEVLRPDHAERYRLAIAERTEDGFRQGHSLVPFGYYKVDGGYRLRVYDPSLPQAEQAIEIDPEAGTWRYELQATEDRTIVYEGTPENGNLLYFAPVRARLGVSTNPFSGNRATVVAGGDLQAVASRGEVEVGIRNGMPVEDGGTLTPYFASCPLCGQGRGMLKYELGEDESAEDTTVDVNFFSGANSEGDGTSTVGVQVGGTTGTVRGVAANGDGGTMNRLTVGGDGAVSFQNGSGGAATVSAGTTNAAGDSQTVTVTIDGNSTSVRVSSDDEGRAVVDLEGVPEGADVTITVTSDDASSESTSYSFEAGGDSTTVRIDPVAGTVATAEGTTGGSCFNGTYDADFEVGVDCGDTCAALCTNGRRCEVQSDCAPEHTCLLNPDAETEGELYCKAFGCDDGVRNRAESDVDCGGDVCDACVATLTDSPMCSTGTDCDTGICTAGRCSAKNQVFVNVIGLLRDTSIGMNVTLDGVATDRTLRTDDAFNDMIPVGTAYAYSVEIAEQPDGATCTLDAAIDSAGTTGLATPAPAGAFDAQPEDRFVRIRCVRTNARLHLTTRGLVAGARLDLTETRDGSPAALSVNQNGTVIVGQFSTGWSLAIDRQPGQVLTSAGVADVTCAITGAATGAIDERNSSVFARIDCTSIVMGMDAGTDAGVVDAGADAGTDAGMDAGTDAGMDAGTDAGMDAGPMGCTTDSDCSGMGGNCYCGASSGSCAGDSGECIGAQQVIDTPTTDGVAESGSFTVPAACSEVFVQMWGAGGGSGGENDVLFGGFMGLAAGGSGGYVQGTLPVATGDVIRVWVGQGGGAANRASAGTASIGSAYGTLTNGGQGSMTGGFMGSPAEEGGGGGGLTSLQQTGSVTVGVFAPGGGGAGISTEGEDAGGSGGAGMPAGADATTDTAAGGGGAGATGGSGGDFYGAAGNAGTYGGLPAGFTTMNGPGDGAPAATGNADYSRCIGFRGVPRAGRNGLDPMDGFTIFGEGGDGCVVLRCAAR